MHPRKLDRRTQPDAYAGDWVISKMGTLRSARMKGDTGPVENGYILLGVLLLVVLFSISLSVAVPQIARSIQQDREWEAIQRGRQYTRAIQLFYKRFGKYPSTLEELLSTSNQRFLRKRYIDPITGKDDWKLIHLGEAKVPVLGFFSTPILASTPIAAVGVQPFTTPDPNAQSDPSSTTTTNQDMPPAPGVSDASSNVANPLAASSIGSPQSTNQSSPALGSADGGVVIGQIVGVGIPLNKSSLLTFRTQSNYSRWEFVYNPLQERRGTSIPVAQGADTNGLFAPGKANSPTLSNVPGPTGSDPQNDPNQPPNPDNPQ